MSGIFGIINLRGESVAERTLRAMQSPVSYWGPDGIDIWYKGVAGFGQLRHHDTPEAIYERLPCWLPEQKMAFTAEARIDNRDELCDLFHIPHPKRPTTPDSTLILKAYLRWGEDCTRYLLGDWSFAVWHAEEQRLFIARDHHGITSLYYFQDANRFVFSSSRKSLLALGIPRRLDELYLGQLLIAWFEYNGSRTIDLDIHRLPPAHALRITPDKTKVWQYWHLENTPELRLPKMSDYVEGLLDVYNKAVKSRLRSCNQIGVALSGGLDSGSVTALAANELAQTGTVLHGFTSVPLYNPEEFIDQTRWFGNERKYSSETAAFVGENVFHHLVNARNIGVLEGIENLLQILDEPQHAACNGYWVSAMLQKAKEVGINVLLTGQGGNPSISWHGAPYSTPLRVLLRSRAIRKAAVQLVLWALPNSICRQIADRRASTLDSKALLNSRFIKRTGLDKLYAQDRSDYWCQVIRNPRTARYRLIMPGRSLTGALWTELGAAYQISIRDATEDKRILEYCVSVPESMFWGRTTDENRWLIRCAMKGLLPESVRLNKRRGRQAADSLLRVRNDGEAIEAAIKGLASSCAANYLDVDAIRGFWQTTKELNSPVARSQINVVVLRSLMAGLFLREVH